MMMTGYGPSSDRMPELAREDEADGLSQLVAQLRAGASAGPGSTPAVIAVANASSVWSALLEDLVSDANDFPADLKAKLISIGIFVLKELDAIRGGRPDGLAAVADITQSIADGLK